MSCSRGSIENPTSGKCKRCESFTVAELKKLSKSLRLPMHNSKDMLCKQLIRALGGRARASSTVARRRPKSRSRTPPPRRRRQTKSRSRSPAPRRRRPTYSRDGRTLYAGHHYTSNRYRSRTPSQRRAPRRSVTYYGSTAVVSSPRSYPRSGVGSLQSRHSKPGRVGPSKPAQAHCGGTARGNDGNLWQSRPDKTGRCAWRRL